MRNPTRYGQTILDLLCDRTASHEMGWLCPIGETHTVVEWLSRKLGKTVKSVAGAISDLIAKGFLNTGGVDVEVGNVGYGTSDRTVSIDHQGWQAWGKYDRAALLKVQGFSTIEEWEDWDGLDGTELGAEWAAVELFGVSKLAH